MTNVLKEKLTYKDGENEEIVWWDEEHSVGRNTMIGYLDQKGAEWLKKQIVNIGTTKGGKVNWIVDLSKLVTADKQARGILKKMDKLENVGRIAFVGGSAFARTVTNFITTAAGKTDIRHFAADSQALNWFKN